jgi:hypothetical protein
MKVPRAFGLSSQKDPGQESSYWFYMAALGVEFLATSFALGAGSFVCPSIHEVLGPSLSYSTPLKHPLVVGHRILGFLYGAAVWYSTKTLAHR